MDYFISCIENKKPIQGKYFENSLESIKLILQMTNREKI